LQPGVILHYLNETEHRDLQHIQRITRLEEDRYVWLDRFTIRNLELVAAQQENWRSTDSDSRSDGNANGCPLAAKMVDAAFKRPCFN